MLLCKEMNMQGQFTFIYKTNCMHLKHKSSDQNVTRNMHFVSVCVKNWDVLIVLMRDGQVSVCICLSKGVCECVLASSCQGWIRQTERVWGWRRMSQGNNGEREMPEAHPTVWKCSFSICLKAAMHTYSPSTPLCSLTALSHSLKCGLLYSSTSTGKAGIIGNPRPINLCVLRIINFDKSAKIIT